MFSRALGTQLTANLRDAVPLTEGDAQLYPVDRFARAFPKKRSVWMSRHGLFRHDHVDAREWRA
jgi:hypothetical protein